MRITATIFSLLIFFGCRNDRNKINSDKDKYFYIKNVRGIIDTTFIDKIGFHQLPDTLIAEEVFLLNKNFHVIRKYTNKNHIKSFDGGVILFELDSLGEIYSCSTTWPSYSRLHSTNDSIESLINYGIEAILLNENLCCKNFEEKIEPEMILFTPP